MKAGKTETKAEILLSIIVPCYNEEKNIPLILNEFGKAIEKSAYYGKIELILVDNNSKDNSAKIIKKELSKKEYFFARTIFQPVRGYGAAIKKGLKNAKGEYLCWTHADLQTDMYDTIKALGIILKQENPEKCYIKGNRKGRKPSDVFFAVGMSFFESALFFTGLWDINAQPNLFHKSFMKCIKNPPCDASFDLHAYYSAKKAGYKIIRFTVMFPERVHGTSSWNTGFLSRIIFIRRTIKFSLELRGILKRKSISKENENKTITA